MGFDPPTVHQVSAVNVGHSANSKTITTVIQVSNSMFKFDVYSFYAKGYTAGFLPKEIVETCRQLIDETDWYDNDFHVKYPTWNMLPDDGTDEYYQEIIRELKTLNSAPPRLKYIGECILA